MWSWSMYPFERIWYRCKKTLLQTQQPEAVITNFLRASKAASHPLQATALDSAEELPEPEDDSQDTVFRGTPAWVNRDEGVVNLTFHGLGKVCKGSSSKCLLNMGVSDPFQYH